MLPKGGSLFYSDGNHVFAIVLAVAIVIVAVGIQAVLLAIFLVVSLEHDL